MKVLCINSKGLIYNKPLEEFKEYEVRECYPCPVTGRPGYLLVGIYNFNPLTGNDRGYLTSRFVPMDDVDDEVEELVEKIYG